MAAELEGVMRAFAHVRSSEARFEETRQMAALSAPIILKGRLEFVAPDRLVKRIETPRRESYTLQQGRLTLERSGEPDRTMDADSHPALHSLSEAFRATLAGDVGALKRHFSVTFKSEAQGLWSMELVPLDARVAEHVEKLILTGRGPVLLQAITFEAGGDQSDMRITPP